MQCSLWFLSLVNEGWFIYFSAFYYLCLSIKDRLFSWMNECFGGFFSPLEILSAFLLQEKSMSFDLISVFYYVRAFKIANLNFFIFKSPLNLKEISCLKFLLPLLCCVWSKMKFCWRRKNNMSLLHQPHLFLLPGHYKYTVHLGWLN